MNPGWVTAQGRGVRWAGAQRDVLNGDIRGHVDVESLSTLPDLYALGPLEGVRGEVSIFRSRPSIARVEHGAVITAGGWDVRACFLVWAQIPAWYAREIEAPSGDLESIAKEAVALARAQGLDVSRPFPFHVTGTAHDATLHVLDKRDGLPHTPERHEQAKVRHRMADAELELIGFHSRDHRGVFTPADSDVHAHIRAADGSVSGHLERIRLAPGARIGVPAAGFIQ
jgi:acetolactate decarboxylase